MAQDEFTMSPEEFRALRDQSAAIGQNDVQLGRMLDALVLHLGHAHGLDPAQEDAKAERLRLKEARRLEDEQLQAEADARLAARQAEDAQPSTPAQEEARVRLRAQEDARLQAEADERARIRAEEDARLKEAGAPQPSAVAPAEPVSAPVATEEGV